MKIKANKNCQISFNLLGEHKIENVTTEWKKYVYTTTNINLENGRNVVITPENNTTTYFYEGFLSEGTIDNSMVACS